MSSSEEEGTYRFSLRESCEIRRDCHSGFSNFVLTFPEDLFLS